MKFYLIFPFLILIQLAIFAADTNMKDIANWSKEQMDAYVGIGTYNTKEYDEFPAKFKNNIWYWYGIKNYQDEKYSQSLLCFETYTYSARDLHDGQIASGNAALQLGLQKGNRPFAYAAVAYEHAIKGFPDNYRARAGAIIANAMLDQYQDVEKQVGEAVALMNRQKNDGTRSALLRAILPAMIFTNQRNEFASVVSKLGDDDLKAYPDLALNYAKGVYNFKIESEYKRADAMLKALGLGAESVLKKMEYLFVPRPEPMQIHCTAQEPKKSRLSYLILPPLAGMIFMMLANDRRNSRRGRRIVRDCYLTTQGYKSRAGYARNDYEKILPFSPFK